MKELIYFEKEKLAHVGGPYGYLCNLYEELEKRNVTNIDFLENSDSKVTHLLKKIKDNLPKEIKKIYLNYRNKKNHINYIKNAFNDKPKKTSLNINNYDVIHFHTTMSMYLIKDSLKDYKGKVVLTSHTPKAPYKEYIEDKISKKEYLKNKKLYDKLEEVDEYAFERADYIIFPCKEAEEPYFNTWEKYNKIRKKIEQKIIYLPTGIPNINTNIYDKKSLKSKYSLPQESIVISYVGRHNEVKGYDELKKIATEVTKCNKNIHFIIGGKEGPLYRLENEQWHEIGWTNKPYEIIKCSDAFILPNKETYFDLILLEVIALEMPVILTKTGGNKFFSKYKKSGLLFYDYGNIEQAVKLINSINSNKSIEYGKLNKQIFLENFTIEKFTDKYIEIINKICE